VNASDWDSLDVIAQTELIGYERLRQCEEAQEP
jgi:hypothetical protein